MALKSMGQLAEEEDKCTEQNQFLVADLQVMDELRKLEKSDDFEAEIVWRNVVLFAVLHVGALVGLYNFLFAKWATIGFGKSGARREAIVLENYSSDRVTFVAGARVRSDITRDMLDNA
jgi:hypothetical protein